MAFLIIGAFLCLLGALLLTALQRRTTASEYIVYTDAPKTAGEILISRVHGLKGKPDAIIRLESGRFVPVERKSRRAPIQPYETEVIQAAAYGLLIEEHFGSAPPFLRLEYSDRIIDVPFTQELRRRVMVLADKVKSARGTLPDRSHEMRAKCQACGRRVHCGQELS